jgi:hypothetical protein
MVTFGHLLYMQYAKVSRWKSPVTSDLRTMSANHSQKLFVLEVLDFLGSIGEFVTLDLCPR